MYHMGVVLDVRFVAVSGGEPILEVLRGSPVVDASGAIVGITVVGTWERVPTSTSRSSHI